MLHIILLCLKIIGIILLVLIGLILLILLTVLLVPVRYRAQVRHGEAVFAKGRITWLLHILGAEFTYIQGEFHMRVRVLWITLYDNLAQKDTSNKKAAKRTATKKSQKKAKHKDLPEAVFQSDTVVKELERKPVLKDTMDDAGKSAEYNIGNQERKSIQLSEQPVKGEKQGSSGRKMPKQSIVHKFIGKIKNMIHKLVGIIKGIKKKIMSLFDSITDIKQKINLILDFIRDEYNKEGFHITYSSLKKLLKHVLPRKLKSRLVFGTGDPCSTGQALGAMSILYSFYGDKIVIIPDFENKRLEGEHEAAGRIRMVTVLIIVVKLILNKRFKQLKNNFQILKEAL